MAQDQLDLMDSYRTFHTRIVEYTFFSSTHGMFSTVDHMLGHKTSLSKFKRIEIISGEGNGNPLQYSLLENSMDGGT